MGKIEMDSYEATVSAFRSIEALVKDAHGNALLTSP